MVHTPTVQLGDSTLNRKWFIDVNTGTSTTPEWTRVRGRGEFQPTVSATKNDVSDFDGEGYRDFDVTALEWGVGFKVHRKSDPEDATIYDPGQEALRLASLVPGGSVEIRYWEYTEGRVVEAGEAWQGRTTVEWSEDGGDMAANSIVTVTLTGKGKRTAITNPSATV